MTERRKHHSDALFDLLIRASEPSPTRQCRSVFSTRRGKTISSVYCCKKSGHKGDHRGERAQWVTDRDGCVRRVPITEPLP